MKTINATKRLELYTRWEHGQYPVVYENDRWELHQPTGIQTYKEGAALLAAIYGKETKTSVDRYFKLGKYSAAPSLLTPESISTLSLFSNETVMLESKHIANRKTKPLPLRGRGIIRIKEPGVMLPSANTLELLATIEAAPKTNPIPQINLTPVPKLGIDLKNRSDEVRKLLYAGFGKRIHQLGYDPEDVLQEVYRGLLARNEGKCPWDKSKSTFGHYVHMVCGCILSNYHRRYSRINSRETVGVMGWNEEGEFGEMDAALSLACHSPPTQANDLYQQALLDEIEAEIKTSFYEEELTETALLVLPLLIEGYTRRQISKMTNVREGIIAKIIKRIQAIALQLWGKKKDQDLDMVIDLFGSD